MVECAMTVMMPRELSCSACHLNEMAETNVMRLSLEDQQRFVDLLLDPPPLTPAMHRAAQAHAELIQDA
ncbi:DUF1778 domain-containing protein [Chromatium okenii]|jgi:hypothetical protein|uniref:DUF1778 domain-containing protein n=1 Tax=Chromatium okenii TaxID=61644 RepID=A0A2S7XLZ5_9GAMM|nr:DUF1778 domain-containing protein [Chromatium okenii]PQJ94755.1 hypothetical protein CXB77_18455 [Chromatium okenii]